MSLIHQALKKLESADYPAASLEYSFRKPGIKTMSPLLAPLIILSIAAAYLAYPLASGMNGGMTKQQTATRDAISEKAQAAPVEAPATPSGLNEQGIEEYRSGRFEEAEALLKKTANEKRSAIVHSNLGVAALRLGKKNEAEAAFKKALELEPENVFALNNYASLLAEAGKTNKAIEVLERAIKADASYADAHFNQAVMLEKKGDLAGALARYEEFLRLAPADVEAKQVRKKLMALRSEIIVKQAGGR
jgi:tetratricopeptide (TPR) repeat protein